MSILQRNKKAAVGIGVAALAVAAIALGTGTYAAFTSTQGGPGGTLAAGTLTLDVSSNPTGTATLFDAANIYPGQVLPTTSVTLKNSGTIDGTLTSVGKVDFNLGGVLQNYLTVSSSCRYLDGGTSTQIFSVKDAPVTTLAPGNTPGIPLKAGQTAKCTFTFALPYSTPNEAQGGKVVISSSFTLTQAMGAPTP